MSVYSCLACGHVWTSRVPKSVICPKCKKYLYVVKRELKPHTGKSISEIMGVN
jgi:hypothetical protein